MKNNAINTKRLPFVTVTRRPPCLGRPSFFFFFFLAKPPAAYSTRVGIDEQAASFEEEATVFIVRLAPQDFHRYVCFILNVISHLSQKEDSISCAKIPRTLENHLIPRYRRARPTPNSPRSRTMPPCLLRSLCHKIITDTARFVVNVVSDVDQLASLGQPDNGSRCAAQSRRKTKLSQRRTIFCCLMGSFVVLAVGIYYYFDSSLPLKQRLRK